MTLEWVFRGVELVALMAAIYLLVGQEWRRGLMALAVVYAVAAAYILWVWSPGLAAVKLVTGWMAVAVLGAAQPAGDWRELPPPGWVGTTFYLIASGLVILLVYSVAPLAVAYFPVPAPAMRGGLILIGMGMLHLGMSTRPFREVVALLTALAGFDLLYTSVEQSVLVAGVQAFITLGLALVGSYVVSAPSMRPGEEEQG
ncbi:MULTISPECIES: hypothetical protein [Anaerolinea]|uniref:hypothetical protein n=1 Tax=Anaerolinea TaxID=233189 RepID=UPI002632C12B|nr:hypothetical protein [Anaerolinea thermophila]